MIKVARVLPSGSSELIITAATGPIASHYMLIILSCSVPSEVEYIALQLPSMAMAAFPSAAGPASLAVATPGRASLCTGW